MSISEHEKLTIDEFFEAISGRDGRYELVGGVVHAIPGARQGHNVIRSNVLTAFLPAGKRKGCRATLVNTGVQTGPATIRYPDVVVDCGPPDAAAMKASKPTIIVEISSPSTPVLDQGAKLREYQSVDSIDTVMQIESETAQASNTDPSVLQDPVAVRPQEALSIKPVHQRSPNFASGAPTAVNRMHRPRNRIHPARSSPSPSRCSTRSCRAACAELPIDGEPADVTAIVIAQGQAASIF